MFYKHGLAAEPDPLLYVFRSPSYCDVYKRERGSARASRCRVCYFSELLMFFDTTQSTLRRRLWAKLNFRVTLLESGCGVLPCWPINYVLRIFEVEPCEICFFISFIFKFSFFFHFSFIAILFWDPLVFFAPIFTFPVDIMLTEFVKQCITWCQRAIWRLFSSVFWGKWRVSSFFCRLWQFQVRSLGRASNIRVVPRVSDPPKMFSSDNSRSENRISVQ